MTSIEGVIDVGSNTVRLLVARIDGRDIDPLCDESAFVRLGLDLDVTGCLRQDRQESSLSAVSRCRDTALRLGAAHVLAIATGAVREAQNGAEFARRVHEVTGVAIEILSGAREASLTYRGATTGLSIDQPHIVCDLGGASTEVIAAEPDDVFWAVSLPIGSGRLAQVYLRSDPPQREDLEAVYADVKAQIHALPPHTCHTLVLTGGTASHLAGLAGMSLHHGSVELSPSSLDEASLRVSSHTARQVADAFGLDPERAAVLPAGFTALRAIVEWYRPDSILVTSRGIREGLLLERSSASEAFSPA